MALEPTQTQSHNIADVGPVAQVFISQTKLGIGTTAGSTVGNGLSNLQQACGYKALAVGATSSATGVLSVQRYIDAAGTIAQGAAITANLTAGTPGLVNITDDAPFLSFTVSVSGTGTLTNVAALLNAN